MANTPSIDQPDKDTTTSKRPWYKRWSGGGQEPPPIRLLDLMLMVIGGAMILGGITANLVAGSSAAHMMLEEQVSVTAILDAADQGQLESVRMPPNGTASSALTSTDVTSGQLYAEAGKTIAAGTQVNFYAPDSVEPYLLAELAKDNVTVWMSSSVPPVAATPGARVAAPMQVVPRPASQGSNDWYVMVLLLGGAAVMIFGAVRHASYRTHIRSAALKESMASKQVSDIPTTRFSDVAGAEEAVEQMRELVDFLKYPERFTVVGAKIPKGALLVGPPGTGKTLLARAVAGEAGVAFHAVAGSDFVEKYVGVGAQRVRALFAKARESERAIIFIDEIDAVARRRSDDGNGSGGHVEGENTLMAMLHEMDGFRDSNVIVLAATNRPDILDPALTRPGRLDRRIEVPLPDRRGREQILKVHAHDVPLAADVDLVHVAKRTPGFSGAQLESVLNEAALEAARRQLTEVTSSCVDAAVATVAMGRARTSALVTERDREITAWHEAGHTVAALMLADADAPVAVSIVPRGPAGGVTWMSGSDEQFLSRAKAHARLVVALGGRSAEKMLMDGEFTQGAAGDLQQATETALLMATRYGMTRLGLASRAEHLGGTTTKEVAAVVEELLAEAHAEAMTLLEAHRDLLEAIAMALLEHEDLDAADLAMIAARHGVVPASKPTPVPAAPTVRRMSESAPVEEVVVTSTPVVTEVVLPASVPVTSGLDVVAPRTLGGRLRSAWRAASRELKGRRVSS